jgi:hypothetical protein
VIPLPVIADAAGTGDSMPRGVCHWNDRTSQYKVQHHQPPCDRASINFSRAKPLKQITNTYQEPPEVLDIAVNVESLSEMRYAFDKGKYLQYKKGACVMRFCSGLSS